MSVIADKEARGDLARASEAVTLPEEEVSATFKMADSGSYLLGALGKAFEDVLKKDVKKDSQEIE